VGRRLSGDFVDFAEFAFVVGAVVEAAGDAADDVAACGGGGVVFACKAREEGARGLFVILLVV